MSLRRLPGPGLLDALEQRFLGHLHQLAGPRSERFQAAHREAVGAVGDVAAVARRDVDLDQVAALELARARDAVDDLVVHRNTDVARIAEVAERGRLGVGCLEHARRDLIQVSRGHARLRPFLERTDRRGDDLASLAHDRDLARRLEHNGVVSSRLQMHRTACMYNRPHACAFLTWTDRATSPAARAPSASCWPTDSGPTTSTRIAWSTRCTRRARPKRAQLPSASARSCCERRRHDRPPPPRGRRAGRPKRAARPRAHPRPGRAPGHRRSNRPDPRPPWSCSTRSG